jgi:hypothetical protein
MTSLKTSVGEIAPPPFASDGAVSAASPTRLGSRQAYYYLVNIEEHPEALPLAYDIVVNRLQALRHSTGLFDDHEGHRLDDPARLTEILRQLTAIGSRFSRPWRSSSEDLTRRQVLHYFVQYMPAAFVDGCWLQGGLRVATAHTGIGASLTGLYQHQLRAFVADTGRHFVADYHAAYSRLGSPVEDVSSHSFAQRSDFQESSFALPVFLLSIAQFARTLKFEIVGLNLAWQFLGLSAFGPSLIRDTCEAYALPALGDDLEDAEHFEKGRERAREAVVRLLADVDESHRGQASMRLLQGLAAGVEVWTEWVNATARSAPSGPPDPRQEMIDLVWRKAPHASGYHGDRRLGSRRIDEYLDPKTFNGPAMLEALARSPWVRPGKADKSALLNRLIGFGGPMMAVFSPVEQQIIRRWIESLPAKEAESGSAEGRASDEASPSSRSPSVREEQFVTGRSWEPDDFRRRSQHLYGKCTVRELYHYLVNAEFFPHILPIAERFAQERLERSMAMLWKGERPIPSSRYDPAALQDWVYRKHREQVDSYRPPEVRPEASKDAFIEATIQLAPLILIDGGWLQGVASPALIHTTVGRMLFHVLVEELGEGNVHEHHANIYRVLLKAMGEEPPPVDSWEFARWQRLQDASFDVPTLWLSISCFPRHFLPEILGLNLAVELAGVGGPYMEARDTLRRFRYPSLFVDVHNAADNVSVGHSAWAMDAIKRHLDEVAEREGPHNVDRTWQRVWTGVRATLPQIGRVRMMVHRIQKRLLGTDPTLIPRIFPV